MFLSVNIVCITCGSFQVITVFSRNSGILVGLPGLENVSSFTGRPKFFAVAVFSDFRWEMKFLSMEDRFPKAA